MIKNDDADWNRIQIILYLFRTLKNRRHMSARPVTSRKDFGGAKNQVSRTSLAHCYFRDHHAFAIRVGSDEYHSIVELRRGCQHLSNRGKFVIALSLKMEW